MGESVGATAEWAHRGQSREATMKGLEHHSSAHRLSAILSSVVVRMKMAATGSQGVALLGGLPCWVCLFSNQKPSAGGLVTSSRTVTLFPRKGFLLELDSSSSLVSPMPSTCLWTCVCFLTHSWGDHLSPGLSIFLMCINCCY